MRTAIDKHTSMFVTSAGGVQDGTRFSSVLIRSALTVCSDVSCNLIGISLCETLSNCMNFNFEELLTDVE